MITQPAPPTAEDYLSATESAFARCPNYSGLRLISVDARHGYLSARFEGPVGDFRGPYGVRVSLPADQKDPLWSRYTEAGSVADWAQAAVVNRALEVHALSVRQERGYTSDDVWWLIDDSDAKRAESDDRPTM